MKVFEVKKRKYMLVAALIIVFSVFMAYMVQAGASDPGTDTNPIVSQDYVDAKVNDLTTKINDLTATVNKLNQQLQNAQPGGGGAYQVINLKAGQTLIGGASTEIILRSGQAKIVTASNVGVSDLTGGKDLAANTTVTVNHLLLVPRDDGRGIKAVTEIYVMVKGTYTIS